MNYFLGLDLGQAADYSALAILETERAGREAVYRCRHLQRWPLRTPYPQIVSDVVRVARSKELRIGRSALPVLAVDATGVGPPVVDLIRAALNSRTPTAGVFFGDGAAPGGQLRFKRRGRCQDLRLYCLFLDSIGHLA